MLLGYLCLLAVELASGFIVRGLVGAEFVTFLSGVIAGLVTARIAVARPLLHACVLAVVVVSITIAAAAFSKRPLEAAIPAWYPYAAALLAGAGTFVGGALSTRSRAVGG